MLLIPGRLFLFVKNNAVSHLKLRFPPDLYRKTVPCALHTQKSQKFTTLYDAIDKDAATLSEGLDSTYVTNVLKNFISAKHDSGVLKQIFEKGSGIPPESLNIEHYLLVLKVCSKLKICDLDLVSSLSINLNSLLRKAHTQSQDGDLSDLKQASMAICRLYNELKILYDPLFLTISNAFSDRLEGFTWDEISLLLHTYSGQRYNDVEIVKTLAGMLEVGLWLRPQASNLDGMDPNMAASMYLSLAHLEYLSEINKRKLETVFTSAGGARKDLDQRLTRDSLLKVAYANILIEAPTTDDLELVLACLARNFTVVAAYVKCLHKPLYDRLDGRIRDSHADGTKTAITNVLIQFNEHRRAEASVFTEKVRHEQRQVSEHLRRMRIRCETNVYKNGVLLDVLEFDQNLVWLCNSYHRFYATTFNMTANSKLLTKLIKAFGYKVATINYYQWGRMKCKRTRFAFLRMARYYALKDKREYDPKYSGWSLPYIWWNYNDRDRLHISHYDHYNP